MLGVYLGISPVYWLPGVPVFILALVKLGIFLGLLVLVWVPKIASNRIVCPAGAFGWIYLIFLLAFSFAGFFQSEVSAILRHSQEILTGFVAMWTGYLLSRSGADVGRIASITFITLLPAATLTLLAGVLSWPSWVNPFLGAPFTISNTGLGGLRTGWSVAFALIFAFSILASEKSISDWPKHFRYFSLPLILLLLIGNQVVVGGRSGILASFVVLCIWFARTSIRNFLWLALVLVILAIYIDTAWLFTHLRLDRLSENGSGDFSAGRLVSNKIALDIISETPFTGVGVRSLDEPELQRTDLVHNLWLRLWIEYGLFVPLTFLFLNFGILVRAIKKIFSLDHRSTELPYAKSLASLLAAGFVVSMFEPRVLIGTFQTSAVWWFGTGLLYYKIQSK